MAIVCLPIDASSGAPAYTAQQTREAFSGLHYNGTARPLGSQSGVVFGSAPVITATGTTWSVGAGNFVVDPAFTTTQAPYLVAIDAATTGSVTAAAGSQRIDGLDLQISDTAIDSSGARAATVVYTAGTAGSGSAPAVAARSLRLATITVPASGGGSPTVSVNQQYSVAAGGILPVASSTTRTALITNPVPGMATYRLDARTVDVYDATLGWQSAFDPTSWTAYTPVWSGESGGVSNLGTGGTIVGRYKQTGKNVTGEISMLVGTSASGPAGIWNWSLPVTAATPLGTNIDVPVGQCIYYGGTYVIGMAQIRYPSAGTQLGLFFHGQSAPAASGVPSGWGAGVRMSLFFEYEAA